MPLTRSKQFALGSGLIAALLLTLWAYWPGLGGSFLLDDSNNLSAMNRFGGVSDSDTALAFVFSGHGGALGRPLALLSFLLNDQAFPGDVAVFRLSNLLLHCLCGIALFVFFRQLLRALNESEYRANVLALLAASWWLLAPLNVSTTLYVIQRMTQLSALFVLLGLMLYLRGREQLRRGQQRGYLPLLAGLFGFGGLAVLSKENGALIFIYALVCEMTLCFSRGQKPDRGLLAVLLLPLVALLGALLWSWQGMLDRYQYRDFTLAQRLLTELSILWDYLRKAMMPIGSHYGLVHDDFPRATALFSSWLTPLALLAHGTVLLAAWCYRRRWPLLFFATGWFYGGHLLESTLIPLELYYEHRNYLPIAAVMLALVTALWKFGHYPWIARGAVALLLLLAVLWTHKLAMIWGDPDWQTTANAVEHPGSVRAQTDLVGTLLRRGEFAYAQRQLEWMNQQWPELLHIDLLLLQHQCLGHFNSQHRVETIVSKKNSALYSGNLSSASKGLIRVYRQRQCAVLDDRAMLALLDTLMALPMAKAWFNADVSYWQAEVYQRLGNLDGAMAALDRAFANSGQSIFRYQQALLLQSAGLGDEASRYIHKAIVVESRKPVREQGNIKLYRSAQAYLANQKDRP